VGVYPWFVAVGDLNNDGRPDLAVANGPNNIISVLLGNGNGTFGTATNFPAGVQPFFIAIGDVNADGKPDLAVASYGGAAILLGDDSGGFGAATTYAAGLYPSAVAMGDLNGDAMLDLALTDQSTSPLTMASAARAPDR
jgi:hypothetical protein